MQPSRRPRSISPNLEILEERAVPATMANRPPTLDAISQRYVAEGALLSFRAGGRDPDAGQTLTYSLGSGAPAGAAIDSKTGAFTWRPSDGWNQNVAVQVKVTDPAGLSASRTVQIIVRNDPPTAQLTGGGQVAVARTVVFSFASMNDPSAADRAAGYRYSFDLNNDGDFTDPGEVANVTLPSITSSFAAVGTYTVRGRIADKDGGFRDYRVSVQATNRPPTLAAIPQRYVAEGALLTVQAAGYDPDGHPLRYSLGAGAPAGMTINPDTGLLSWHLDDGAGQRLAVQVKATDPGGLVATQSFQIVLRNEAPTAQFASSGQLVGGKPVTFAFSGMNDPSAADRAAGYRYSFDFNNDGDFSDPGEVANGTSPSASRIFAAGTYTVRGRVADKDGGFRDYWTTVRIASSNNAPTLDAIAQRYVAEGALLSLQVVGRDPDAGQKLTYSLGAGAPAGMTINPTTGLLTWRPDDGSGQNLTVQVKATDPGGLSATQSFQIVLRNEAPTAQFAASGQLAGGKPVTFAFSGMNDVSAADRAAGYRYSFDFNNDGDFTDPGEIANGTSPSVTRTFAAAGTYTIRGRIADKDGGFRDYRVTVQIGSANHSPTLDAIPQRTIMEGQTLSFVAVGRDPDAGQKLTYSLGAGAPAGATINRDSGQFTWRPDDGPAQGAAIQIKVTDPAGLSASRTFQVVVTNDAPTASFTSSGQLEPNRLVTFAFSGMNDVSAADRAAGYRYSFDFNNDGDFTDPGEIANGTSPSATRTFAAAGTYTIHGRIADKDGGFRDYRVTVRIAAGGVPGRVADLAPGTASSSPTSLFAIGRTVYFAARTPSTGEELFRSDGTTAGTVLVKDITPGPGGSLPRNLTNVNGVLYFVAQDATHGTELWRSDGTAAGTWMVKDINPGTSSSWPEKLTNVNGTLYFTAYHPSTGIELWRSDGTAAGTQLVVDLVPGTVSGGPNQLTAMGSNLAFVGTRLDVGSELFLTNGTAAGTMLVRDINPGRPSSFIAGMINAGGSLYFSAYTPSLGSELWRSNGTAAGTVLVKDIAPGAEGSSPNRFVANGNRVFFVAGTPNAGAEPWVTNGTTAGTTQISDINSGLGSSVIRSMVVFNGIVYFAAENSVTGIELWRSDGTAAGTRQVADIQPGTASSSPEQLVVSGGSLYFVAWTAARGEEVWKTDGTAAGTKSLSMEYAGVKPGLPEELVDVGGTLFFAGYESAYGTELWTNRRP